MQTRNEETIKMRLSYTLLIEEISKKQGLGLHWNELPVIITTDTTTYTMAYITYEDTDYMSIIIPDKDGAEYGKILNKNTILSVELIYAQMLTKEKPYKEDGMYG